jgi:N-terminal domain of anti-restriction factor ArdC
VTKEQIYSEALQRASNPTSVFNIEIVLASAEARGIADAKPRENVLTFNAWKAKGRVVKKGEKALCMLATMHRREVRDTSTGEVQTQTMAGKAAVFHISQTKELSN